MKIYYGIFFKIIIYKKILNIFKIKKLYNYILFIMFRVSGVFLIYVICDFV